MPSRMFFFFFTFLGIWVTISSDAWLPAWVGLELNMMALVPLLISKKSFYQTDTAMKYFLIQALGAAILLFGIILSMFETPISNFVILISLALKMGAAPLHTWFPSVLQGSTWVSSWFLLTVQKLSPLVLISYLTPSPGIQPLIILLSVLSAIAGALGGFNQTFIRKIMAFSSINHLSWMLAASVLNLPSLLNYFLTYSAIVSSLLFIFHTRQLSHLTHILNSHHLDLFSKITILVSFLSLGGMPPFLGFSPKLEIIFHLVASNNIIWIFPLLISALMTLFFYLRMAVSMGLTSSPKSRTDLNLSKWFLPVLLINLFPFLCPLTLLAPF